MQTCKLPKYVVLDLNQISKSSFTFPLFVFVSPNKVTHLKMTSNIFVFMYDPDTPLNCIQKRINVFLHLYIPLYSCGIRHITNTLCYNLSLQPTFNALDQPLTLAKVFG